ncbi:outer membrane immunogenic protein [Sphingomonas sp. NFR04]|uniref:outer membrane protein n=1 Tax=Sphingomonas sp. NFR04 TaxID=1566283 RepID=UPI0008E6114A|nr:porin family protein [Sphingomonas sp. NFR04]SFJ80244.1 outer membrane immunogenic protein [Sphingomonas sp. NFR04]
MRTKLSIAILAATTAFAAPAFAQSQDQSFAGSHAEVIAGWDRVNDKSSYDASKDGVTYGGNIGYDIQRGSTVFGVEGEVTGSTISDRSSNVLNAGDRLRVKAGRDLYVGGRLGFVAGPRTLIYAKAGYTNAQFITDYSSPNTTPALDLRERDNYDGWRLGAGAEFKLTDKVFAKAEYRYSNYGSQNNGVDPERHQIITGLGVRF